MNPTYSVSVWGACFLFNCSVAVGCSNEPKQDALTAEQVLDRTAKVYANCKSYRDSGSVKTVFIEAFGNRTVEKPFTTAFVRPDRFRFEYKQKKRIGQEFQYIVWRQKKDVQIWWDVKPGIEKRDSLRLALEEAKGVSGSSAHDVVICVIQSGTHSGNQKGQSLGDSNGNVRCLRPRFASLRR